MAELLDAQCETRTSSHRNMALLFENQSSLDLTDTVSTTNPFTCQWICVSWSRYNSVSLPISSLRDHTPIYDENHMFTDLF